ncbi:MAG: hypothetical protein CMO19_01865 [Thaumarchaeota archaeon]|nr:hypothetical protein [Nitrososphaerota archaeon]
MNFTKFEKRENPLLERTEISAVFDVENTSFNRREAATLVAKEAKINPDTVYSVKLSHSSGSHSVSGLFYVYKDQDTAKVYLPKFILNRNIPKVEKAPAEESKEAPDEETKE